MKPAHPAPQPTSAALAIDVMYFPTEAKDLDERCQKSLATALSDLHDAGVDKVFITQCKRWNCDRHWLCEDAHLEEVLRYTLPYPQQFIGIGAYNPMDIAPSIHDAEVGIHQHGFRGVYVHPGSFGVSLSDRRMYPLFVKALDWRVPVILDLRRLNDNAPEIKASELRQVAGDFPDIAFVSAQGQWSSHQFRQLAEDNFNLSFCFDVAALLKPGIAEFATSALGQDRCIWGSNGFPWKQSIAEVNRLTGAVGHKLLRDNAVRIFGLDRMPKRAPRQLKPVQTVTLRVVAE
jgi:predicted TIM-barrel fold metal-dependent hydrolase